MKYYQFSNPNPDKKKTGDCGVRCLAYALDISWMEAYELLAYYGRKNYEAAGAMYNIDEILVKYGFTKMGVKVTKGKKRPTMRSLIREDANRVIVGQASHHVITARNGKVLDIWDTTLRPLYRYYVYKETPCRSMTDVKKIAKNLGICITVDSDFVGLSVEMKSQYWDIRINPDGEEWKDFSEALHDFLDDISIDDTAILMFNEYRRVRGKLDEVPMELLDMIYEVKNAVFRVKMFLRALDDFVKGDE